jgi:hypothetical protein
VFNRVHRRDKKVVGVFVRFRAPLHSSEFLKKNIHAINPFEKREQIANSPKFKASKP